MNTKPICDAYVEKREEEYVNNDSATAKHKQKEIIYLTSTPPMSPESSAT